MAATVFLSALAACGSPADYPADPPLDPPPSSPEAPSRPPDGPGARVRLMPIPSPTRLRLPVPLAVAARTEEGRSLEATELDWVSLTPTIAEVTDSGQMIPLDRGVARIRVFWGGVSDSIAISVDPVVASLVPLGTVDTLRLDEETPLPIRALDSGGVEIRTPRYTLDPVGTGLVTLTDENGVRGELPGPVQVLVRADDQSLQLNVLVEGVAVLVDGNRQRSPGVVTPSEEVMVTNGRLRLRWRPALSEKAGFEVDTRVGTGWTTATGGPWGDWLYPTSTVTQLPTRVEVVSVDSVEARVDMRFDNHRFDPVLGRFPPEFTEQANPFTRSTWLRAGERGYYSFVVMDTIIDVPPTPRWIENEIGWGGVWGPATIRHRAGAFRTDTMSRTTILPGSGPGVVDAVEFIRDGDPLIRVLVPLPGGEMISPVFPGWGFGSVYLHHYLVKSYGAYMYVAPRESARSARFLCERAWTEAPFPLPQAPPTELASCGPDL